MIFTEELLASKLANAVANGICKGDKHVKETPALYNDMKNMRSRVITSFIKEDLRLAFTGYSYNFGTNWDCLVIEIDGFKFSFASETTFAQYAKYRVEFEDGCLFEELRNPIKNLTLQELQGNMCWVVYDESFGNLKSLKLKSKSNQFEAINLLDLVDTPRGHEAIIATADTDFEIIAKNHKTEAK